MDSSNELGRWLDIFHAASGNSSHQPHLDYVDNGGGVAGLTASCSLWLITLTVLVFYIKKEVASSTAAKFTLTKAFFLSLFAFEIIRIAQVIYQTWAPTTFMGLFILHRLATASFVSTFLLILFFWIDKYHRTFETYDDSLSPRALGFLLVCNLLVYGNTIAVILVAWLVTGGENVALDIDVMLMAAFFAVMPAFFALYAFNRWRRYKKSRGYSKLQRWEINKALILSSIFMASFTLRFVLDIWLFLPNVAIPYSTSMWFNLLTWRASEIIPSLAELWIVYSSKILMVDDEQDKYIDDLYTSSDEDRERHVIIEVVPNAEEENGLIEGSQSVN